MHLDQPPFWQLLPVCSRQRWFASGRLLAIALLTVAIHGLVGCSNFHEKRTITAFQEGLEEKNLEILRKKATPKFEHHALRHPEAGEAIDQLRLPDGKFEIVDVDDISKTEKKITIAFGESKRRKVQYHLVKNEESKDWQVEDILLRQRSNERTIIMPVTEQMDVLLSSREFYEAWQGSDRRQAPASCDEELAEALSALPPSVMARTVSKIIGKSGSRSVFRPEVHINGERAVAKLHRPHGELLISMINLNSQWKVKDLALESNDEEEEVKSLVKTARITNQAIAFLDSWEAGDKDGLKELTNEQFYNAGLAPSKLTDLKLPSSVEIDPQILVKLVDKRADVVVNGPKRTLRMTMKPKSEQDEESPYRIANVTLYDAEQDQTLSLASALTARPVAEVFIESLKNLDRKMLRYSCTRDFHQKTWNRVSMDTLNVVPMPYEGLGNCKVEETQFLGDVTHIHMKCDSGKLTVVLNEHQGKVLVDDMLIHNAGQQMVGSESLKDYLGAVLPVYELASRIHHEQSNATMNVVTNDFYDRVFSLTETMPKTAYEYLDYVSLGEPIVDFDYSKAKKSQEETTGQSIIERYNPDIEETIVRFNTENGSMVVTLHHERGMLRVDDAIVNSAQNSVAKRLKQSMRMDLANARTRNMIQTVSGEMETPPEKTPSARPPRKMSTSSPRRENEVVTAHYEEEANAGGGLKAQTPHADPTVEKIRTMSGSGLSVTKPGAPHSSPASLRKADNTHLLLQPIPTE